MVNWLGLGIRIPRTRERCVVRISISKSKKLFTQQNQCMNIEKAACLDQNLHFREGFGLDFKGPSI